MRIVFLGLALLALPTVAIAQMGGGMGGGGMGGMGGGMRGGHRGQQDGGQRKPEEMKSISRNKLDKPVTAMFELADVNHDGIVTLDELQSVLSARRDQIITARFNKIDTNGDKVIDQQEFFAWQRSLGSVAASDDAAGGGVGPIAETLAPPLGNSDEDWMLRRIIEPLSATVLVSANTNYDKGVSLDELLTYERARFDKADTDHDGMLSAEEFRSAFASGGGGERGRFRRMGGGTDGSGSGATPGTPSAPATGPQPPAG